MGAEIYLLCGCWKQALYESFLACWTCHLPIWNGLSLFGLLLPFMYREQFQISSRKLPRFQTTNLPSWMMKKALYQEYFTKALPYKTSWVSKAAVCQALQELGTGESSSPHPVLWGTANWVQGTFLQNNGPGPTPQQSLISCWIVQGSDSFSQIRQCGINFERQEAIRL